MKKNKLNLVEKKIFSKFLKNTAKIADFAEVCEKV
jgi:hypothetical protein